MASTITNVGRDYILRAVANDTTLGTLYIGWGTGAGTASATDTALFSEQSGGSPPYSRVVATLTLSATNTPPGQKDTMTFSGTIQANGVLSITNAGVFDATGDLLYHSDFPTITTSNGNNYPFTFNWIIA